MNLYIKPLGPWQKMAVRMLDAWGKPTTAKGLVKEYRWQEKIARKAMHGVVLSSLVIRGYATRKIVGGEEVYTLTPQGRELARRLESAGTDTSTR